jgi:DNA-binding winged helix-turn-helix (wHTH) protein
MKPGVIYDFGPFQLDTEARRLVREGVPVTLAPKSFELLQMLVENHGRALSRADFLAAVWPDTQVEEGNLSFQVMVLRRALGPQGAAWIETVPKYGYRFTAPVVAHPASDSEVAPGCASERCEPWRWYLMAAALAVVAIALGFFLVNRPGATEGGVRGSSGKLRE